MLKTLHSVIGTDIVGEIMEVGQGVRKFKPGDKVVAFVNPFVSYHEYYIFLAPVHLKIILAVSNLFYK